MRFCELKEQVDKGNLSWKELLTPRILSPEYRQNLRHEVIKRNIPWFVPCKDLIADRIEMHIDQGGRI